MKTKSGYITSVELLLIIGVIGLLIGVVFIPIRNFVFGNRQIIDFNYNYNTAYILSDDNKFERVKIKAWKDWDKSDSIQVIKLDGTPIYTHLRNVKLTKE